MSPGALSGLTSPGALSPLKTPKSPSKVGPSRKKRRAPPGSAKPEETRVMHVQGRRTLYTSGRPPWYNKEGQLKDAFIIGIIWLILILIINIIKFSNTQKREIPFFFSYI